MADKYASIISNLIAVLGFTYALYNLRKKRNSNPSFKILGFPIETSIKLVYFGIFIYVMFIVLTLLGYTKF
jgi:hypothetical protein